MRSIRVFAKNMGNPYYEPTIVVHDNSTHIGISQTTCSWSALYKKIHVTRILHATYHAVIFSPCAL